MVNINRLEQLNRHPEEHQDRFLRHRLYRTVAIDVDSCLTAIEGIDLLAKIHGVGKIVTQMTKEAMEGDTPFNIALANRLGLIQPSESDLDLVSEIYMKNVVKDAQATVKLLQENDVDLLLLSGGFRRSIIPLAKSIGIPTENVFANDLIFNKRHEYIGFDETNPLSQKGGKRKQVKNLKKEKKKPIAIIGDGVSELETAPETDFRIGFGGFVTRKQVVKEANVFLTKPTFAPLILLLLSPDRIRKIFYEQPENREILIKAFYSIKGVIFNDRAKLLERSIIELYEEFVFYSKNLRA